MKIEPPKNSNRELAKVHEAEFEIKDFTDVSVEECIERDRKRQNYVGEKVIRDMAKRYFPQNSPRKTLRPMIYDPRLRFCVIFDIDGTLACIGERSPYDSRSCDKDLVNPSIAFLNNMVPSNHSIVLLSGRMNNAREETVKWLDDHNIKFDHLYMRNTGDFRKDAIIKQELYDQHIKGKMNVTFVVDDRDQVVRMWRDMGLTVLQCNYGDF